MLIHLVVKGEVAIDQKFLKLDEEKQEKILSAAFKEFAEQGYERASTNNIVKNAEIGKGMLFYYFHSKQELYHFLINYALDYVIDHYFGLIDEQETDFIEKYKKVAALKMKAYLEKPYIFYFLGNIYLTIEEAPEELRARLMEIRSLSYTKMFRNIDLLRFREDLDPETALTLIRFTMEGYENELVAKLKAKNLADMSMKPLWDEFYGYLDILKKVYYK